MTTTVRQGSLSLDGVAAAGAEFSHDRTHRLKLWRQWDPAKPTVLFIMLNPSLASETKLDPTVRKCVGFAARWGYGKLFVGNLYTVISPYPEDVVKGPLPAISSGADQALLDMVGLSDRVVVAWGTQPWLTKRAHDVCRLILFAKRGPLWCLGRTQGGWPRHPLYRSYEAALEPYVGAPGMKPIVFLDIDGVLHTRADRPMVLNAECVRALNCLTDLADAEIVVSSTWRFLKDIRGRLRDGGVQAPVIGSTPDLGYLETGQHAVTRGAEIARWLEIHSHRAFVILDDDEDMGDLLPYLVQTEFTHGLTWPLAELALGVLERVHA